jgi:glucose-6-phosphate-specific signal transduction histidine kinase
MEHESDLIRLHIIDDGSGFTMRGDLLGFGIRGMRKRASDINADLNITSSLGAGTSVTVTVRSVQRNLIISHLVTAKDHVKSILERGRYATDKQ